MHGKSAWLVPVRDWQKKKPLHEALDQFSTLVTLVPGGEYEPRRTLGAPGATARGVVGCTIRLHSVWRTA